MQQIVGTFLTDNSSRHAHHDRFCQDIANDERVCSDDGVITDANDTFVLRCDDYFHFDTLLQSY